MIGIIFSSKESVGSVVHLKEKKCSYCDKILNCVLVKVCIKEVRRFSYFCLFNFTHKAHNGHKEAGDHYSGR